MVYCCLSNRLQHFLSLVFLLYNNLICIAAIFVLLLTLAVTNIITTTIIFVIDRYVTLLSKRNSENVTSTNSCLSHSPSVQVQSHHSIHIFVCSTLTAIYIVFVLIVPTMAYYMKHIYCNITSRKSNGVMMTLVYVMYIIYLLCATSTWLLQTLCCINVN